MQEQELKLNMTEWTAIALATYLENFRYYLARKAMKELSDVTSIRFKDGAMTALTEMLNVVKAISSDLKNKRDILTGKETTKHEKDKRGVLDV